MSDLEERPRKILRAEATLMRLPVFALAIKGSSLLDGFEYRHVRRKGRNTVEVVIRTERDASASYPGPLSRRVHMAVLSIVAEHGIPFSNPVAWSWRDLCRRMGLPNSGRRLAELKGALRATWGLKLFGLEAVDGRSRETWRRLYSDCEFLNELRPDGTLAEGNRLWLAPWYIESLNALHSAPLDYELWKRLERVGPLASRMYEYLLPSFYKREALELAYDRLAGAMPVVAESRRSHAVRQFTPAIAALQSEGVVADAGWDAMKGTGRPKLILTRGPLLAPREASKTDSAGAAALGVQTGSTIAAESTREMMDPDAPPRLAAEFYRHLGKDCQPLRSDLRVAQGLIARFGQDVAFGRLPDAVRRLKARFRNAETMGALPRYFEESVGEAEAERLEALRRVSRADSVAATRRLQEDEDIQRRAAWELLPESDKAMHEASVLAEHPTLQRFPILLEAACLCRMSLQSPQETKPSRP